MNNWNDSTRSKKGGRIERRRKEKEKRKRKKKGKKRNEEKAKDLSIYNKMNDSGYIQRKITPSNHV